MVIGEPEDILPYEAHDEGNVIARVIRSNGVFGKLGLPGLQATLFPRT